MNRRVAACIVVFLLAAGCREGLTAPTSDPGSFPAVFGMWSGTLQVNGSAPTNWSATVFQVGPEISGTIGCSATSAGTTLRASSAITQTGQLTLSMGFAACGTVLTGQLSGNSVSGTLSGLGSCGCFGNSSSANPASGTWSGTKQ
jgi:hypothetical protein